VVVTRILAAVAVTVQVAAAPAAAAMVADNLVVFVSRVSGGWWLRLYRLA
jgi:hypothetical protein